MLFRSAFAVIPKRARVLDLCCGTGVLALLCHRNDLFITGFELQAASLALFARSIALNQLENVETMQGDLRNIRSHLRAGSFDYIVCNPPYFSAKSGFHAQTDAIRTARQDETANLDAIATALAYPLRSGGRCAVVFRPERLCELMLALEKVHLIPKRLRFVHDTIEKPPSAVLIECRKDSAHDLRVLPPLLVHHTDGSYTDEYNSIYMR